jgi:hypothetical protein
MLANIMMFCSLSVIMPSSVRMPTTYPSTSTRTKRRLLVLLRFFRTPRARRSADGSIESTHLWYPSIAAISSAIGPTHTDPSCHHYGLFIPKLRDVRLRCRPTRSFQFEPVIRSNPRHRCARPTGTAPISSVDRGVHLRHAIPRPPRTSLPGDAHHLSAAWQRQRLGGRPGRAHPAQPQRGHVVVPVLAVRAAGGRVARGGRPQRHRHLAAPGGRAAIHARGRERGRAKRSAEASDRASAVIRVHDMQAKARRRRRTRSSARWRPPGARPSGPRCRRCVPRRRAPRRCSCRAARTPSGGAPSWTRTKKEKGKESRARAAAAAVWHPTSSTTTLNLRGSAARRRRGA